MRTNPHRIAAAAGGGTLSEIAKLESYVASQEELLKVLEQSSLEQARKLEDALEERKRIEKALRNSERFLQSVVDALSAHVAILDESGRIIATNKAWRRFASASCFEGEDCGIGMSYLHVCDSATGERSDGAAAASKGIREVIAFERDDFHMEYPCPTPDGKKWFAIRVTRLEGEGPVRVVVAHEDITERKRVEEQLVHDAFHDPLTGLPNRALFLDRLKHSISRAVRNKDYSFAVLFLDLDHFKFVNDSLGHLRGDQLLTEVARRIDGCVRSVDSVARLGGDEFAVLLDGIGDASDAARFATRLQSALSLPLTLDGSEFFITASIGIALSETGYSRPEDLLRDADTTMYRAKVLGRGRHEIFDQDMHTQVVKRLQLETDLRKAVERNEFIVYYRPIISLKDDSIAGFEALVRWRHPKLGLVSPGELYLWQRKPG